MEGSKSTPVSNGVPPLSRISYVLSKNKQTVFPHRAKLVRLSLVLNLVEFCANWTHYRQADNPRGRGRRREIFLDLLVKFTIVFYPIREEREQARAFRKLSRQHVVSCCFETSRQKLRVQFGLRSWNSPMPNSTCYHNCVRKISML